MLGIFVSLVGLATGSVPAVAQSQGDVWAQPVNLSNSGAASQPVIAAEPDGKLHALWWDQFEGTKYATYSVQKSSWTAPVSAPVIVGDRTAGASGKIALTPPGELVLLADGIGQAHAFWIDGKGDLRYARAARGGEVWSGGLRLAEAPLAWDVTIDADNVLHLAFLRTTHTDTFPAGVYYSRSTNGGASWETPEPIAESLYFRSPAPEDAHVAVVSNGQTAVLVAWDDPQLKQALYARSTNGGAAFGEAAAIPASGLQQGATPQRARFLAGPNGVLLMLWEAGGVCALYQQQSSDGGATWNAPQRVLETLNSCMAAEREYPFSGGGLFLVAGLGNRQPHGGASPSTSSPQPSTLLSWDGSRWSAPLTPQISFVDPLTHRSTALGCVNATLGGDRAAVIGCDGNGDVWATVSQVGLSDLLPALTTAWSAPITLSKSPGDAGLPTVTTDAEGRLHALWSESPAGGGPGTVLTYVRGDGVNWSAPAVVLRSPEGKAESPSLVADAGGMLHAVWSGGYTGEILYSQAFIRDAASSSGWSSPKPLPSPRAVGGWPDLAVDASGSLQAVYAVPLNEDRGVYYTRSDDQGVTWITPSKVFDAATAEWAMARQTSLAVDGKGRLHVVWVRAALPEDNSPLGVYYARSDDGLSWSAALEIAGGAADRPQIIAALPDQIHLVWIKTATAGTELWHQWSPDGGETWSAPARVPNLRNISPGVGLAADGNGVVYLVGIERTQQDSAALFYLRWDGQGWVDRESVPLGYDPADPSALPPSGVSGQAGATAILFASGPGEQAGGEHVGGEHVGSPLLGVFYRVRAPIEGGGSHYVVGYTQRPIEGSVMAPVPTFTPRAVEAAAPTATAAPALTPIPTPDLAGIPAPGSKGNIWLQIGGVLVGMIVVVAVAVRGLSRGRK